MTKFKRQLCNLLSTVAVFGIFIIISLLNYNLALANNVTLEVISTPKFSRNIPASLIPNEAPIGEGYPWYIYVGTFSDYEIDNYSLLYGAFEFRFKPVSHTPGTLTWTRFEVEVSEGTEYLLISTFDEVVRTGFRSLWLPLEYEDYSPGRYLFFTEGHGTVIITTHTYTFRNWNELSNILGLNYDISDTIAQNPSFPSLPISFPYYGIDNNMDWVRVPLSSTTTLVFSNFDSASVSYINTTIENLENIISELRNLISITTH